MTTVSMLKDGKRSVKEREEEEEGLSWEKIEALTLCLYEFVYRRFLCILVCCCKLSTILTVVKD